MSRKVISSILIIGIGMMCASPLYAKCTTDHYETESSEVGKARREFERRRNLAALLAGGAALSAGGSAWCFDAFAKNSGGESVSSDGQLLGGVFLSIAAFVAGACSGIVTCNTYDAHNVYMWRYDPWNVARQEVKGHCQVPLEGPLPEDLIRRYEQLVRSQPTFRLDILDYLFNFFIYGDEKEELCPDGEFKSSSEIVDWIKGKSEITIADFLSLSEIYRSTHVFPEAIKMQYAFFFDLKPQAQDIYAVLRNMVSVEQELERLEKLEKNLVEQIKKTGGEIEMLELRAQELAARIGKSNEGSRPEGESNPEAPLEEAAKKARAELVNLERSQVEIKTDILRSQTALQEANARRTASYEAFAARAATSRTSGAAQEPKARFEEALAGRYRRMMGVADASGMGPEVAISVEP
jgi:hypothetical protein